LRGLHAANFLSGRSLALVIPLLALLPELGFEKTLAYWRLISWCAFSPVHAVKVYGDEWSFVLRYFGVFLAQYRESMSYLLPLFLYGFVHKRIPWSAKAKCALLLFSFVGYALVSSMRHFGRHYLIYMDVFAALAVVVLLDSLVRLHAKRPSLRTMAGKAALALAPALLIVPWAFFQCMSFPTQYYNFNYPEALEKLFANDFFYVERYNKTMRAAYGSPKGFLQRIEPLLVDPADR